MVAHSERVQRIARLTPLGDVLALVETLARPVAAQQMPVERAFGLTLAADATAAAARPPAALAMRDGWAVRADDLIAASAHGPLPLPQPPAWCETGEPLPAGCDAVAPFETVIFSGPIAEAIAPVTPGEGVLAAGADVAAGRVLCPAGTRLRRSDVAALHAAGIGEVSVRAPRLHIVATRADPIIDAIVEMLAGAVADAGGIVTDDAPHDAEIIVGGTGSGKRDASVRTLARTGTVAVHGIAIAPGETAALGRVDDRPVLLVPGRLDAALAVWLAVGRALLARLCGRPVEAAEAEAVLSRKVTSRLGLAEVVLVRRDGDMATPLAREYLSLAALASADGWLLIPADSEGHPAGTRVTVRPLP
jgi:molybdopterin biosynthesis enzyme